MRVRNLTQGIIHLIVVNANKTPIRSGEVPKGDLVVQLKTTEVEITRETPQGSLTVRLTTEAASSDQLPQIHGGGGNGVPVDTGQGNGNQNRDRPKIRNMTTQPLPFEVKDENGAVVESGAIEIGDFEVYKAVDIGLLETHGALSLEIWEKFFSAN